MAYHTQVYIIQLFGALKGLPVLDLLQMVGVSCVYLRCELLPVGTDPVLESFKVLRFVLVPEVGLH